MSKLEVVSVNLQQPEEDILTRAALILERGNLVVAPTETRYGLLARADQREPLEKLYRTKARSESIPTALFVDSRDKIYEYGENNDIAGFLAERYLPGPLTLILKAVKDLKAPLVVNGKIGIRVSSSPFIGNLVAKTSFPLTATSANISGRPEHDTVEEIVDDLGDAVELYIDAGILNSPVSTVVDCSEGKVEILREGFIAAGDIRNSLLKAGFDAQQ